MTAERLIRELELLPHPEGGFYRETFRSPLQVSTPVHPGPRAAATAIYYLLPRGVFSAFHRVRSDEQWHFYAGAPLVLHLIDESGRHERLRLGLELELEGGARPQAIVPAGVWQAVEPVQAAEDYSLCGCTVAPGFEFVDWEEPSAQEMLARFPAHADLIARLTC